MNKLYIIILLSLFFIAPTVNYEAIAQRPKREHVAKRRKVKTKRRVRRRVSRRAHVRYAKLARYGSRMAVLPVGAIVVKRGTRVYHYHKGIYYSKSGAGFVVVKPVRGIRVKSLPAARIAIGTPANNMYYYYGNYYIKSDDSYEVTEAPMGTLVDALPEGYEIKEIDGAEYYVWDDNYYREIETDQFESGQGYEVVQKMAGT